MVRLWLLGLLVAAATLLASDIVYAGGAGPWAVYYASSLPAKRFFGYRLIVFDPDVHPPIGPLTRRGIVVLGYISLGEVENYRRGFEQAKSDGYVLAENRNWPGSFFVDVRDKRWQDRIVHDVAARIMHDGFDGFMLDTLDNAEELERRNPERYSGMTDAAAKLVRRLRKAYPSAKIMVNRAFGLYDKIASSVDYVLAESTYTDYDSSRGKYTVVPHDVYAAYLKKIAHIRRLNPKLEFMSLDYWNPGDPAMIRKIYRVQRRNGFSPYVSVPSLDRLVPEPKK